MMRSKPRILMLLAAAVLLAMPTILHSISGKPDTVPANREEVVFWHFWGGDDRAVVADVVKRFNESQNKYWVREIAMPGNNQQAKLFLSTTGGDPPDLVNQDDPILADWAKRGLIHAMDEIASEDEVENMRNWMFESARRLSEHESRLFAVCNGLDIRALYVNRTALKQYGCEVPKTIEEFDRVTEMISPSRLDSKRDFYAYLPDSRRLWAWGFVFGGEFFDSERNTVTFNTKEIQAAAEWMQSYARRYGAENIAAYRTGDQSLPGKSFPLLPLSNAENVGRYVMLMDGQWRTRDIRSFNQNRQKNGVSPVEFEVAPLPTPSGGRSQAGWVNGNFFVVPKGARNSKGAWEFIKFWVGFTQVDEAAKTCADGGWIPVSEKVVQSQAFQKFLEQDPLFAKFVALAASPHQYPVPVIPGAPMFKRTVEATAFELMSKPEADVEPVLRAAETRIQSFLEVNQ